MVYRLAFRRGRTHPARERGAMQKVNVLSIVRLRPAGASNLLLGDLWGSDVTATTSRGAGNTLAMAEYALAGIFYFAKGLRHPADERAAGKFDFRAYRPLLIEGKTACVVGAGGI